MSVLRTAAGNGWNWKTAVLKLPSFELADAGVVERGRRAPRPRASPTAF